MIIIPLVPSRDKGNLSIAPFRWSCGVLSLAVRYYIWRFLGQHWIILFEKNEGKNVKTDKNICITLTLPVLNLVLIFLPYENKSILLKFSSTVTWSLLLNCRSQGVYRLPTNSWATRDISLAWAVSTSPTYYHLTGRRRLVYPVPFSPCLHEKLWLTQHKACG